MKKYKIEPPALLSTLWIFILFNMIFRDLHQFASEGFIQEIMALEISQEMVLVYGIVLEIPIAMVLLSRILDDKFNKWANIIAGVITSLGLLSSLPTADMDDIFFIMVESAALLAIIRIAWKLTSSPKTQTQLKHQA
ncbi:DUF6326 family protein [Poritiphilus flavus]|uniref:Uncharacterized protein n=1 Tax=Poritiphilus flavus TaxID=2697053 RepID=A0A6L9EBU3_9FLAO|nr:DUF6326 family protein [Poritiphilus flavus]NAS12204.1 hypothetical protein [Poritiphilus flavus]